MVNTKSSEFNPTISVIVPAYDVEKYLARAVDSILAQTFVDFELIIVDDGSKDATPLIADEYAAKYNNVFVIHKKNEGHSQARKSGLENANGKYICFVDADDYVSKDMLSVLYNKLIEEDADEVCCRYVKFNDKNFYEICIENSFTIKGNPFNQKVYNNIEQMCEGFFVTRDYICSCWGRIIKTDILRKIDFPTNIAIGEEFDMSISLLPHLKKVIVVPDILYYYYVNLSGASHGLYNDKYITSFYLYQNLAKKCINYAPMYKSYISAFFVDYEMAVITAMCRKNVYNWALIKALQKEIKNNMEDILFKSIGIGEAFSAILIAYTPHLFIWLFKGVRRIFNR